MTEASQTDRSLQTLEEDLEEFVTFSIGTETFGVDVMRVHEIIGMTDITPVPNSVEYVKGVINLRGKVVPVVDMRTRFRLEKMEYSVNTVIIIVAVFDRYVGMIVDAVSDVVNIRADSIHEGKYLNTNAEIQSDFIKGIGQFKDQLIIILDVDRILQAKSFQKLYER
jgi:purine-binding chemotaxis protein CheW